ncbi:putative outer membrane porin [Burkholderia pseudomallei]|nr:putative outer membrane porin [Burkholderia pseudomallei]
MLPGHFPDMGDMMGDVMNAKSIAAAALAVAQAGLAHAQSSVTLYGALDAGVLWQNTSAASFSPTAPNTGAVVRFKDGGVYSSLWGIKGTEDLGGGYRVNFRLQGAFDGGTGKFGLSDAPGAVAAFNQIATLGVSGPFGTFNAGRQIVPMIYAMADTDVRAARFFGSVLTAWLGLNTAAGWPGNSTNAPIGALYDSDALVYQSPAFGGASLALEYAPGGVPGGVQRGSRASIVLKYASNALNLAAVYYNGHDTNPAPGASATGLDNNRFVYVGAQYKLKDVAVSASYGNGRNPARGDRVNLDMFAFGLGYRVSPFFRVSSGVYYLKDRNRSANRSTSIVLGADYELSKHTTLYAQGGRVDNRGTMAQMLAYGQPVAPGLATTAAMLGMRHSF